MPRRSVKRKKTSPVTATKSTRGCELSDTEPNLLDRNNGELKSEKQDLEPPAKEEAAPPAAAADSCLEAGTVNVKDEATEERENVIAEKILIEPKSSEKVIVAAQIDGAAILGHDIKVPTLNDNDDGEEGDDRSEVKQDVRALNDITMDEVVVSVKEEVIEVERERIELGQSEIEKEAAKVYECPLEPNSCEEVTVAAHNDGSETFGDDIKVPILNGDDDGEAGDDEIEKDPEEVVYKDARGEEGSEAGTDSNNNNGKDTEHEGHSLMVIDNVINDKKNDKKMEIFVARLDKKTVEEDLIEVFGKFGQIKSVKVVRNKTTNKSKGFAFVQYASTEQAESAISASEGGIKVKGKHVKASMSNDNNNTLYLGNICRLWTTELVLETLKNFGIENIAGMRLPGDPHKEGRTRGYAFLEFDTHSGAISALERLSKPDAIFGCDESAKVSFSRTPLHPSEDALSQGKTVYVEGLTDVWTEAKVKEFCEQYGEVEEVRLSQTLGKKRKDCGFISFASRDSAHACLKGFRNACIGELLKVKATIARVSKCRPQKHELHGGFKVEKERGVPTTEEEGEREKRDLSSNMNGKANSNCAKGKGNMLTEERRMTQVVAEAGGSNKSNENLTVSKNHLAQASLKSEKVKGKGKNLHMKAERRGMSDSKRCHKGKTSEKAHGKRQRNQSASFGKRKRDIYARKGSNHNADFGMYRTQYATGHGLLAVGYEGHSYNTVSRSKRPYADMEPHAGYLETVPRKKGQAHSGHFGPPVAMPYPSHAGTQHQPCGGPLQTAVGTYHLTNAIYQQPSVQVRYVNPGLGTHGQPHAGYLQPAAGNSSVDLRGVTTGRVGWQDHGIIPSAYGAGSSFPPSYPQHYTSHVGYEAGSSGVSHYQSSGVHQPRPGTYY